MGALGHNSPEYLHLLIEALRLAFADGNAYVADPEHHTAPLEVRVERRDGSCASAESTL